MEIKFRPVITRGRFSSERTARRSVVIARITIANKEVRAAILDSGRETVTFAVLGTARWVFWLGEVLKLVVLLCKQREVCGDS